MDKDNTTPHAAADYEREIERTIRQVKHCACVDELLE